MPPFPFFNTYFSFFFFVSYSNLSVHCLFLAIRKLLQVEYQNRLIDFHPLDSRYTLILHIHGSKQVFTELNNLTFMIEEHH